MMIVVSVFK